MKKDTKSKNFIFIPFCLICQGFQAKGIANYNWHGMIKPIVEDLVKKEVNLIQMPCPESQLGGFKNGLNRKRMGISKYDTPVFRRLCQKLAFETVDMIKAMLSNDCKIIAVLGIENSPSCSVKYQYTNKGTIHRPGIFIEILKKMLKNENIDIPFIGVNKRGIKKSLEEINILFNKNSKR